MASLSKVVGVMSCGFLRCLELSIAARADNVAAAADQRKLTKLIGGKAVKRVVKGRYTVWRAETQKAARRSRATCC